MHKVRNDLILIFSLIFIALLVLILYFTLTPKNNLYAYIYYDKEVVYCLDVSVDNEVVVNDVILVVENNTVYVKDSTCSDKICIHQGRISISGQTITCLPNKVFVRLEGQGDDIVI